MNAVDSERTSERRIGAERRVDKGAVEREGEQADGQADGHVGGQAGVWTGDRWRRRACG